MAYYISTFLLLLNISLSYGQILKEEYHFSKEIVYKFTYYPDSTALDKPVEMNMSLLLNKTESLFQPTKRYSDDSLMHALLNTGNERRAYVKTMGTIHVIPATNYQIFKSDDAILTKEAIDGQRYRFTNNLNLYIDNPRNMNWIISSDTMTIHSIFCQKATLAHEGRQWEAWFAPEIPINNGPYKFQGLPGLIIEISDSQRYFAFELLSLSDIDKFVYTTLRKDENLIITTKNEFYKQRKHFRINMYSLAIATGIKPNEEVKDKAISFAKKDNNHIEKY